jgi:hypothetical protein
VEHGGPIACSMRERGGAGPGKANGSRSSPRLGEGGQGSPACLPSGGDLKEEKEPVWLGSPGEVFPEEGTAYVKLG